MRPENIHSKIFTAFLISVIAVVAITAAMWKSASDAETSAGWVAHTNKVLDGITAIETQIHRIESSTRGYVISGKPDRISDRNAAIATLDAAFQETFELVANNPSQRAQLSEVREATNARIEAFNRVTQIRDQKGYEAARTEIIKIPLVVTLQGGPIQLLEAFKAKETSLLIERSREREQIRDREQLVSGLAAIMLIAFLGFTYLLIRKQFAESRAAQEIILKTSMERKAILEAVEVAIISCDLSGLITSFSPAAERMLGYKADEVINKHDPLIFHERSEIESAARALSETLGERIDPSIGVFIIKAEREPSNSSEWTYVRKDGRRLTVQLSLSALRSAKGEVYGYLGAAIDVSRRKSTEEALVQAKNAAEAANRAKDSFLATMSHEIRTPLSGLLGMLELLSMSKLGEEQSKALELARESGASLVRIIDDILDHAKMAEGKLQIIPEPVSMRQIIDRLFNTYAALASKKNLLFKRDVGADVTDCLMADPLRLLQILGNFVSNSIKFTERGHIEVRVRLISKSDFHETISFSVIDTGIGISPEAKERLFQPFEQATAETTRLFGGTGLGLSISRQLAEMMGGTVCVNSRQGEGTEMQLLLTLPVAAKPVSRESVESANDTLEGFDGALPVLIVDDHSTNRLVLEKQLNALGLDVVAMSNGNEALEVWRKGGISMVITDCNMPVMDGYTLARLIREEERRRGLRRIPVIAYTANVLPGGQLQATDAGMDDFLAKPAEIKTLNRLLRKWIFGDAVIAGGRVVPNGPAKAGSATGVAAALARITDDPAECEEILMDFTRSTRIDFEKLTQAVRMGDVPAIELMAHRLKGSSMMIGGADLAEVCEAMERAAADRKSDNFDAYSPRLEKAFASLQSEITKYLP